MIGVYIPGMGSVLLIPYVGVGVYIVIGVYVLDKWSVLCILYVGGGI